MAIHRFPVLCRIQLAAGRAEDSLTGSSNLLALAGTSGSRDLRAESVALQASVLEALHRTNEAIAVWNLNTNAPAERQREALLKVTQLALAQRRLDLVTNTLEKFLAQAPLPAASDVAMLTLGELRLKHYAANTNGVENGPTDAVADTNDLQQALVYFDRLISTFPDSALAGKAELDRGWCFWVAGKIPESLEAFRSASGRLSPSEELAVARFKTGDALFSLTNYADAAQNYRAVADDFAQWPRVQEDLVDLALYQLVRASIRSKDMRGATNALQRIRQLNSTNTLASRGLLLVGQGFEDIHEPRQARRLYREFIGFLPESPLRPELELAIARTYEQEANWTAAITNYDDWMTRFSTNELRPRAEYQRALATFRTGKETNALALFTNFVAQFPADDLAPQAQWWVADHYYNRGDFVDAERNYRLLEQIWTNSVLAGHAYLMAGRAAASLGNYSGAIEYFTNLTGRLEWPSQLRVQALLEYGDALRYAAAGDKNRVQTNYLAAIGIYNLVCPLNSSNESCALAAFEIGDCYLQLGVQDPNYYTNALNAYQQVTNSICAGDALRAQAQVGIALVYEKQAESASGDEQTALLRQAMANYLDVFHRNNLRPGETGDRTWVAKAGMEAARLAVSMREWQQALNFYRDLKDLLPSSAGLEIKIGDVQKHLADENK